MDSRQRVRTTLSHHQPDRIPLDIGASVVTGMHVSCVSALRDYYGLEKRPVRVHEPAQMLGWIDEDLKEIFGVDVEGLLPYRTTFGFVNAGWKSWRMPDGLEVLVAEGFTPTRDTNGDYLLHPQGDTSAPPSARMPQHGYFFDNIIRQPPFVEEELRVEDNLEEFAPISADELSHVHSESQRAAATGRAVFAELGGAALGDIAHVPGPSLKHPRGIRDISEWYISTVARRDLVSEIFRRQIDIAMENLRALDQALEDRVDAMWICGTDFGTQDSSFCSVKTFRSLYLPVYQRVTQWIHENTRWHTFKHSCGAVSKFVDSFADAGFDILNPVQCSAKGMDSSTLKKSFGHKVVFWGGGVDTQSTIPFGTPDEVRCQVRQRCEDFSPGGGFVFAPVHNIQARTPIDNIVAMIEELNRLRDRS